MSIALVELVDRAHVGDGIAKTVLRNLAARINDRRGDHLAWPSVATLVDEVEFCDRAIRKALRFLRAGGWIIADDYGWTCCVEQGRYGHYARKPTLLYAVGVRLPELRWGISQPTFPPEAIEKHGLAYCKRAGELAFKGGGKDNSHRIGTPPEFRELLLAMAGSADPLPTPNP